MTGSPRLPAADNDAGAFEGLVDAVIVVDPQGRILAVNSAAASVWGYRKEDLTGRPVDFLFSGGAASHKEFLQEKVRSGEPVKEVCFVCRTKDDQKIPMFFSVSPLLDGRRHAGLVYVGREMAETRSLLAETTNAILKTRKKVEELQQENVQLRAGWRVGSQTIVYVSSAMQKIMETTGQVAQFTVPVLIHGETGTGKELIAHAIHQHPGNPRSGNSFIAINCASLAESLLESELFGYARGAFTGANAPKQGILEAAAGGTLFLDEIVESPPSIQAKLLRVLDTGEFMKLGETKTRKADVRLIAATNKNIPSEIAAGRFREDLYQRLKGVEIEVPPLRDRPEDIPALVRFYLDEFNRTMNKKVALSDEVFSAFEQNPWTGNVRELRNAVQQIVVMAGTDRPVTMRLKDLPDAIARPEGRRGGGGKFEWGRVEFATVSGQDKSIFEVRKAVGSQVEKEYMIYLLKRHGGKIIAAAEAAGASRRYFHQKLKELGINPKTFKFKKGKRNGAGRRK